MGRPREQGRGRERRSKIIVSTVDLPGGIVAVADRPGTVLWDIYDANDGRRWVGQLLEFAVLAWRNQQ